MYQKAVVIIFAPHQALHDAGYPHDSGVDNDAERRQPEMPVYQRERIHGSPVPELRHQEVDRAKGDHTDPTKRAGMHVADGPVSVVAEAR